MRPKMLCCRFPDHLPCRPKSSTSFCFSSVRLLFCFNCSIVVISKSVAKFSPFCTTCTTSSQHHISLFFIWLLCRLNLVLNCLQAFPTYCLRQHLHVTKYITFTALQFTLWNILKLLLVFSLQKLSVFVTAGHQEHLRSLQAEQLPTCSSS